VTVLGFGLALLIGLSLGLLGGGGSILTVPVLHYVLGYGVKEAIPMSLVVVGLTSGFGATHHWRAGTLSWRTVLGFGPPAMVGAVLGADLGLRVAPSVQLAVFAVVMLLAAVSMLRGGFAPAGAAPVGTPSAGAAPVIAPPGAPGTPVRRPLPFITLVGALVGLLTGFVGVGGGFLYVPALVLLGGLAMREAIGTSLVLILLSCAAGLLRYAGHLELDWGAVALFTALAFVGVAAGSRLVPHVSQQALKRGFAVFLLAMGTLVLVRGR
jgi:uncharacterized membrane protein YfcA